MFHVRIIPQVFAALIVLGSAAPALSSNHAKGGAAQNASPTSGPALLLPMMNSERGRKLFASKGCVVCHAINGVGGDHSVDLAELHSERPMDAFGFAAGMWRGAEAMIAQQKYELGEQIELNGQELADITAFVHDPWEQKKFSKRDIPHRILDMMTNAHGENGHHGVKKHN